MTYEDYDKEVEVDTTTSSNNQEDTPFIKLGELEEYVPIDPSRLKYMSDGSCFDINNPKHMRVLYLHVSGVTVSKIAEEVGATPAGIKNILRSDGFSILRDELLKEIANISRTYLHSSTIKATSTLINCLDSESDKVKIDAAKAILDRVGMKAIEKIDLTANINNNADLSDEQLTEIIKQGFSEIAKVMVTKKEEDSDE